MEMIRTSPQQVAIAGSPANVRSNLDAGLLVGCGAPGDWLLRAPAAQTKVTVQKWNARP